MAASRARLGKAPGECTMAHSVCGGGSRQHSNRWDPRMSHESPHLKLEALWAHHHAEYRDPHQIASQWHLAADIDPRLLQYTVRGDWWETLERAGLTLLVTREYEHLVMALSVLG